MLEVVKAAEKRVLERELSGAENKEYLSMEGLPAFNKVTAELLLGAGSAALKEGRVATLQSLSGTGSLRVGAAFIARFMKGRTVYISNPTWGNHYNIFGDEGVPARPWPQSRSLRAAGCSGRIPWAAAAASVQHNVAPTALRCDAPPSAATPALRSGRTTATSMPRLWAWTLPAWLRTSRRGLCQPATRNPDPAVLSAD